MCFARYRSFNFEINEEESIIKKELKVKWKNGDRHEKIQISNLIYYKSKKEFRITGCPRDLFFPFNPDYALFIEFANSDSHIIYLGKINDKFFMELEEQYGITVETKFEVKDI